MKHPDTVYRQHILDAITLLERYLTAVDEPTFYRENLIQDGVIRRHKNWVATPLDLARPF